MKVTPAAMAVALAASFLPDFFAAAQPDAVLDAMQAELKRSMTLTLNQLDKPYFLSYTVDDEHTLVGGGYAGWFAQFQQQHIPGSPAAYAGGRL